MNIKEAYKGMNEKTQIVTDYGEKHMLVYSALINFEYDINQIKKLDSYIKKNFSTEEKKLVKQILKYGEKSTQLAQEFMKAKQKGKAVK